MDFFYWYNKYKTTGTIFNLTTRPKTFPHIFNNQEVIDLIIKLYTKEYRGKHIGEEAIKLILDYGFNYLNLNNIKLTVLEFNKRAIACYKKCGFKEMGKIRQAYYLNRRYYDEILMDILKEEFNGNHIKNKNM